jgi:CRISPR-associated protein Csx14
LQQTFAADRALPRLHCVSVPVDDVLTPAELETFADTLYQTLQHWIGQGCHLHLLLAGGRKSMAMVGMSVAQLLLGPADRIWHLYSDDNLRNSGRMLLGPDDRAQLIAAPLPRPSLAAPYFTPSGRAPTRSASLAAVELQRTHQARRFLDHVLTPAERALATLVVTEVLTVADLAARLHKSPKTVTNQLSTIYDKLETVFGLQPDVGVKREFLRHVLGPYLDAPDREI